MNNKYNWKVIQQDYDNNGISHKDIGIKYGACMAAINKATKRGDFISRNKSSAVKLAHTRYPGSFKKSLESRAKISKSRIAYLRNHPDQVPYLLNHSSKESYPEKYFKEVFQQEGLTVEKEFKVGLYQLDFAIPDKLINIEIDGDQHQLDQRIVQHDIKRTKCLVKLGWKVMRIIWSKYQKLNFEQKKEFVKSFIAEVNQIL